MESYITTLFLKGNIPIGSINLRSRSKVENGDNQPKE